MNTTVNIANLYNVDLYLWAQENIKLLKQRRFNEVDIEHLIEEIEDMGKSEKRSINSHLHILLLHLLKWEFQAKFRGGSWRGSIRNSRITIRDLIEDSPSLSSQPSQILTKCYADARKSASDETGQNLNTFPIECPYDLVHILDEEWLPE
jgi:hypothetical protein